jgi:hypothetical protein
VPRAEITISTPYPNGLWQKYPGFESYNFGVMAWQYGTFVGELEYINFPKFCSEPKYYGATGYKFWFRPDVIYSCALVAETLPAIVPAFVDGNAVDPTTGVGLPMAFSP